MERDANYVAVGAFMMLLIAMAVGFVMWYSGTNDQREYNQYEIYFGGSVSGLDQGSPVRYLGVDVGRVRRLTIDPTQPDRVKSVVEVDSATPISGATRASLNMQGITGLLFVNLKQAGGEDPSAPTRQGDRYPVIESVDSDFDALLASLPEMVGRASRVFSDENVKAVSDTLESLRLTTEGMPKTAKNIESLISELRDTVKEVNVTVSTIRDVAEGAQPEIQTALASLRNASERLNGTSEKVDRFVASSEVQLGHLSNQGLFELERLLRDARTAANEFRDLSRSLKQNPSQLIYEPRVSGTEISR
ncbi:MAG: MCE family protein [Candidatus Obscuribacterales bacterium]|nr:MCE family protein [Steroidobacteraceae bacterium]